MAVSAQVISCCVFNKLKKIMQHIHVNFLNMFDCWADPIVDHQLLLKSFMSASVLDVHIHC